MLLCAAAALCGGPGSSGWLCKSRSLAYTFTRTYISTTFNDASSMFRCHNGLPIYYCKSQKAWLNATLTSPHALCLNVPWWWWWWRRAGGGSTVAILIPSRGRKSPQAFFFLYLFFLSPSPSPSLFLFHRNGRNLWPAEGCLFRLFSRPRKIFHRS